MTLAHIRKQAVPFLKKHDATFVGLFGSQARREARTTSDVDILVRFPKGKNFFELVRIERELSEKMKKKVDLVTEGALSPHIRDHVLADLLPLYGHRP